MTYQISNIALHTHDEKRTSHKQEIKEVKYSIALNEVEVDAYIMR